MINWSLTTRKLPLSIVHSTDCTPGSAGITQLDVSSQDPIGTLHLHSSPSLQLHCDGVPLKLSMVFKLSHWLPYWPMRIQMKPGLAIGPYRQFDIVQYFVFAFSFFSSKIFFLSLVFSCSSSCLQGPLFVFRPFLYLQGHLHQNYLQRILVLNFEATLKLFCNDYRVVFGYSWTLSNLLDRFMENSSNSQF